MKLSLGERLAVAGTVVLGAVLTLILWSTGLDVGNSLSLALNSATYTVSVTKTGSGTVSTTLVSPAINCGTACSANYSSGTSVTLIATPAAGYVFAGWSQGCSGTSSTCVVNLSTNLLVQANFAFPYTLSVTNSGGGTVVTSSPTSPSIDCGTMCFARYAPASSVTLKATAAAGSHFTGWSGSCSGTGSCVVTMDGNKSVTATFDGTMYSLSIGILGATGAVARATSLTSAGIDCESACTASYASGSTVWLTAKARAGVFKAWSGACSGTDPICALPLDGDRKVDATFELPTLSVTKVGTGTVSEKATSPKLECGSTCSATYNAGTSVTLVPKPGTGLIFSGWSGACTGIAACIVTIDAVKSVEAKFAKPSVAVATTGSGYVASASPFLVIDCGATCSSTFDAGTSVTLKAVPAAGYIFKGWSEACAGTSNVCTLTMDADKNVSATFARPILSVTKVGTGIVAQKASSPAIDCGSTCSASYDAGTSVTLQAAPPTGYVFKGWTGACTGTGPCVVTIDVDTNVTATFSSP